MPKESKDWVVTTSGERPIEEVAKDLRKKGLKVDYVLDAIGQITGVGSDAIAAKLRKVKGVADVSANVPVDIGPPDAEIS
ncbi:MAG: hypothetical protein ACXW5U_25185 [Thermoanaerobaculia bacterium]